MKDKLAQTTPIVPVPCLPPDLVPPQGFLAELRTAYATPTRAYHNWVHVTRVLDHVGTVATEPGWLQPSEVWLAAIYHDAVYQPGAPDNEARSAEMARTAIPRWFPHEAIDVDRVAALIELTARHGHLTPGEVDRDAALFLDCDTAVLGSAPDEYDRYEVGIAEEYKGVVAPDAFRAGRRAFLERLLGSARIYLSPWFHERLDAPARANLRRAIERLSS
jgi:predicted metal-dependent HD superfamily phosphohydrolase